MRPTVADRIAWSVGRSVTLVSPSKMAELIEMPFGLRTRVGPGNHVLDGPPDPLWEGAILGKGATFCKVYDTDTAVICAKTAESTVMPFGLWAWTGPRNHKLNQGPGPPREGAILGERRPL